MVVIVHAIPGAIPFGAAGVDIFFVISGFIMLYITSVRPTTPIAFIKSRIVRIVPAWWFFLGLFAALEFLRGRDLNAMEYLSGLLFIPWFNSACENIVCPPLVPGWTLLYEMFFYAIFAAALWVSSEKKLYILTVVLCAFAAFRLLGPPTSAAEFVYTRPLLLEFLAGTWLAHLYMKKSVPIWACVLSILFGLVLFAAFAAGYRTEVRLLDWGIPSLLIVAGIVLLEKSADLPTSKIFQSFGDASYSIYLSHPLTISVSFWTWRKIDLPATMAMGATTVLACVLVGIVLFHTVEKPMINFLKR